MKRKELFWMIVPCLLFAGVALWMRPREAVREAAQEVEEARSRQPFRLVIEKIEKRPVSAKDAAEGYDTEVVAVLNHSGQTPAWWGKQNGNYGSSDKSGTLLYEENGKTRPVQWPPKFKTLPQSFYWRPGWQSDTKRYEARYLLKLADLPRLAAKTVLHASVAVEENVNGANTPLCPAVPLTFTVRAPNEVIKAPQVSHDPFLDVRQVTIKKLAPAEQKANGGNDTVVRIQIFDRDNGTSGSSDAFSGVDFLDARGQPITLTGGWGTSSGTENDSAHHPIWTQKFSMSAVPHREKEVTLKTRYSHNNHWPLELRISLRRDGKDLSGTLNSSQWHMAPTKGD